MISSFIFKRGWFMPTVGMFVDAEANTGQADSCGGCNWSFYFETNLVVNNIEGIC